MVEIRAVLTGTDGDRLGASQIGKKIADFLVLQPAEQPFGHERLGLRDSFFDIAASDGDILPVDATQDDDLRILIEAQPADRPPVVGDDHDLFEALADFGTWIDDVDQHVEPVVPFEGREIGTDPPPFPEEHVTLGARVGKEPLAGVGIGRRTAA